MKKNYSITELSNILGLSARSTRERAQNESWALCGENRRVYPLDALPQDVRRRVLSQKLGSVVDSIPSKNLVVSRAEAGLKKWSSATKFNRKKAQARYRILNELSKFTTNKGLKQKDGRRRFASYYNTELIKVEPWILEEIPHVSAHNLEKWLKKEKEGGLPALLGNYGVKKGNRKAVTPEQSAFIVAHIVQKPHIRGSHLFKLLCKTFDVHPSRRTIFRFIKDWKQENLQLSTLIEDPRRWKNNHMAAFGNAGADVPHFGHTWEIDSTPADVLTKDGQRLAIIGLVDIYSRRAIILVAPTSKSIAIAAAMRKAMIAWGIPSRTRMDNGPDYQSFHVQAICSALKIHTPELPKYSPEKKPFIERFFGTFSVGFEELLPGFCGHGVRERQALREQETWAAKIMKPGGVAEVAVTMEEFQDLTDKWIKLYEQTPHKGLGNKTPLQVACASHLQPPKIRDERILDILLAPVGRRTVQKKGISIDASFFTSPELVKYMGLRVETRRDLNSAGRLFVFDGSTGKYLCQATNEPLEGQRLEDYLKAKKEHSKGLKGLKRALDKMKPDRSAIQTLLEDVGYDELTNVIPLQFNFENPAVEEAQKAVVNAEFEQVGEAQERISKAVNYYSSTDFLLDDSHKTSEVIDAEVEELKRYHNKNLKSVF